MPIFSRRRLQAMLDELSAIISPQERGKLVRRLNHKDSSQSLPAALELGVIWAVSKFGEIEIEPYWWGASRKPDIYSETFIPGVPVAIEITTMTGDDIKNKLSDKIRQIKYAPPGTKKYILIIDGNRLFSKILNPIYFVRKMNENKNIISGLETVQNILQTHKNDIDAVIMIYTYRFYSNFPTKGPVWSYQIFSHKKEGLLEKSMHKMLSLLPAPRVEGYQAATIYKNGHFSARTNRPYLAGEIRMNIPKNTKEILIPARALADFIAGHISEDEFRDIIDNKDIIKNSVLKWIDKGMTISSVTFGGRDIDKDDSYVKFGFSDDPAIRDIR